MSRPAAPSPRLLQPYSPRRPSPLGFNPPLAPHMAFGTTSSPYSYYPSTPDRYIQPKGPSQSDAAHMRFPPEARRPLAGGGSTQRPRSQPAPAPLQLNTQFHPPTQPQGGGQGQGYGQQGHGQPGAQQDMRVPPSPTPSSTSSLSLYSADSTVAKHFPIGVIREQDEEEDDKVGGGFCACLNLKALFGGKPKVNKILAPPDPASAPAPQMVQTRRRPPPLNM
ncbi:hypothetical protein B0H34DRAFT_194971 [Crassisporium funariophilum]|nr:hypothetical protein B0H34DRAFT_194971 [Crassisporium funariophilum]